MIKSAMSFIRERIINPLKSNMAKKEERGLRHAVLLAVTSLQLDEKVKKKAKELWNKDPEAIKDADASEIKHLFFNAQAQVYIPDSYKDSEMLRKVYAEGSTALLSNTTLEAVAKAHGITREKCIKLYEKGAMVISDSQMSAFSKGF